MAQHSGFTLLGRINLTDPGSANSIVAATGITAAMSTNKNYIKVVGSGGAVDITADPQIADGTVGQILIIQGTDDTNTVKFDNGTGLNMPSSVTLGDTDIVAFIFDGTDWNYLFSADN